MYSDLSDGELVALHRAGDGEAFGYLYARYSKMIKSISRSYFMLGGDGDDLAQEGLLGLLKAANTFDISKGYAFSTFAYTCIRANINTAVRLASGKKNFPLNFAQSFSGEEMSRQDLESEIIDAEEFSELMGKLRKELSEFEMKVLELYLGGLSYGEISAETSSNNKAVDNALQRAKKKLAKYYSVY